MRNLSSIFRIIALVAIAWGGVELLFETEPGQLAVLEYPKTLLFIGVIFLVAIAIEVSVAALRFTLFKSLTEEKQEKFLALENKLVDQLKVKFEKLPKLLTKSKPIEEEGEIELDHNYDGIRELDNKLPPWWLYSFYASIIFAVVYLARFHVFGDYTQVEEYQSEVAQAEIDIARYKEIAKDLVTLETVTLMEEPADLEAGQQIYLNNCVACHKVDGGGGIGPNLTDEHWILGGGIKNVYQTLVEGGRPGKGMVSWKNDFSPSELQQVASYVLSLQGTTPADPKEPEGEVWEPETE
ncbi:cbb3-type cytochrome c oxidase N-terminal domain-containing protein [Psychroflexus montanilacus]|uniref:cbb3-type cytochrome c oxidase N-terminal domain-containing protein n=1 Tax=Psychroflexus montanilacus TaxID=2873598 RepID=UPI001CCBA37B|nr:cbb3-type cytochrome c oxidase N-terminal domain-containing protein [Psychroflexus montanilacus]MBZ9651765.1 c-type cytochrome [Psychroflexus montanilacus]